MKALVLISGGLDSILAAKIIQDTGIQVLGYHFTSCFFRRDIDGKQQNRIKLLAKEIGLKLKTIDFSKEFIRLIKSPRYGFGSNMNPCIDCKILMLKKAKGLMKKTGAKFIITGEVLGQRPMSQQRGTLNLIEKRSGLTGLLLRPLSARHLDETLPVKKGWVNKDSLLAINGRGRNEQLALAKKFKIKNFGWPGGGCLLADPGFSKRLKDLIEHTKNFTTNDVEMLKIGRHFRLNPTAKLVVGRDEQENNLLFKLSGKKDITFSPINQTRGPDAVLKTAKLDSQILKQVFEILTFYFQKCNDGAIEIKVRNNGRTKRETLQPKLIPEDLIEGLRI